MFASPESSNGESSQQRPPSATVATEFEGRVINVTFTMPYIVEMTPQGAWASPQNKHRFLPLADRLQELHQRPDNPLFDSFSYLVSPDCNWNQTLVAWTGRVQSPGAEGASLQGSSTSWSVRSSEDSSHNGSQPLRPARALAVAKLARDLLQSQLNGRMGGKVLPVWLFDEFNENTNVGILKDQKRWSRYAEQELHPLLHCKQPECPEGSADSRSWADYCSLNQAFASRIVDTYKAGDIIWIQDYHLCLVPNLIRRRLPNATIGFYLHTPFPSSEVLRCLVRRENILLGILGSNIVGFQHEDFAQHFTSSCRELLDLEVSGDSIRQPNGRHTTVKVRSVGIDSKKIDTMAFETEKVETEMREILESHSPRRIIVGRELIDANRGVLQKLQAFEVFLQAHPEWRDRVELVQLTGPPYGANECSSDPQITTKASDLSARINGRFGNLRYDPVQLHFSDISKDEYLAYLRAADVCLVTSLRDGMNTTALDYVVCQRDKHGPLIISDFSASAEMLHNAIRINPWDLESVANAIYHSLTMPEKEKTSRHKALLSRVTTQTVQTWTEQFLQCLHNLTTSSGRRNSTPRLRDDLIEDQYIASSKRVFTLDYDGTLTPIVKDPERATPSDKLLQSLRRLATDKSNNIWIISGRDQAFLEKWMGCIPELGLSAEHGSFIRPPLSSKWENMTEKMDMTWRDATTKVFEEYTVALPQSHVERKQVALTWHYRLSDENLARQQVPKCKTQLRNTVARHWDVEIVSGKANVEVRPTFVNKGEIVKRLLKEYREHDSSQPDFVLCLGDDVTDEDMFGALNAADDIPKAGGFACTVGPSEKATLAGWHVAEPDDVVEMLNKLSQRVGEPRKSP